MQGVNLGSESRKVALFLVAASVALGKHIPRKGRRQRNATGMRGAKGETGQIAMKTFGDGSVREEVNVGQREAEISRQHPKDSSAELEHLGLKPMVNGQRCWILVGLPRKGNLVDENDGENEGQKICTFASC